MQYRPSVQLVVAGSLMGLLLLLGSLQWQWLGRISADERERMQTSLGSQVREFTQDFDRELTRAFFWLQVDRTATPGAATADSTGHFERWFAGAPDPQIVTDIFTVSLPHEPFEDALAIAAYDRELNRLVPVSDPPAMLEPLLARLAELPRPEPTTVRSGPAAAGPAPLQPDVPALVIPRPPVPVTVNPDGTIVFSQAERPWDFTIALLDEAYIREKHLLQLLERQFGSLADLPYQVAVTDLASDEIVFCSERAAADCRIADPDASGEFFELRLRGFNRFVVVDDRRGHARPGPSPAEASGAGRSAEHGTGTGALWRVDLRHQAGSLEAFVSSTRRRNLFVSSSVLGLLGASVALLVLSSGRARRLAAQQMEFVAGVSHELRTPLAVIRAAGENLADGVVRDDEQVQQYGQLIADEGRRLTEMVEQVMEFAGFDAGRALDLRPVAVRDVVDAAVTASQPLLAENDASLDVTVADDLPWVNANHAALGRTLHNLISNAVKYGGEDRWVGLSVVRAARDMVAFRVSDHGPGIAEQDLPHIFEPFYRGQPALDGHVHGSGLGLSLVSRIVSQHGGRVLVDSSPQRGTTFTVLVPGTRAVAAEAESGQHVAPMGSAIKRGAAS
jgi:signal transduction histidine kinase